MPVVIVQVDADIVEKCSKMEIAGHPDDIVRATSDVVSLGRKIAAGRLEVAIGFHSRAGLRSATPRTTLLALSAWD